MTSAGTTKAGRPGWLLPRDRSERAQLFAGLVLVAGSILIPSLLGSAYWQHNFLLVNLFVAVAVFQNMLLSDAGQASFGQGAIFGLAAYTTGIVAGMHGQGYLLGFGAGVAAALLLGLLYALPALRVQGYYLGFVTLSAAVVFPELLVALNGITNGINGITIPVAGLTKPLAGGITPLALLILAFTVASLLGHQALRRTNIGRSLRVAAKSPEAAQALGISPGHMRFVAFTLAAFGTGIAGALYVPLLGFVSPYAFRFELSIYFFFAVIIGGTGRLIGPLVGAWILYLVPNALLVGLADYRLLGYGVAALLIMLIFPDGVVGSLDRALRRRAPLAPAAEIAVGSVMTATPPLHAARPAAATPAVAVEKARKAYGKLLALDGVDLTVAYGSIHGLVGPNGSGKTTLLNVLSGLARLDQGRILIGGQDIARSAPHHAPRLGLGRSFQTPRIFDDMSVWENLEIGTDAGHRQVGGSWLHDALAGVRPDWEAASPELLQHAQRRLLEVLRIVAMDADILLLDEPAAGLAPNERDELAGLLQFLRDRLGKTIILVEHDLAMVWRVADRISVLDAGVIVADGAPDAIVGDPRVRALFTGETRA